MTDQSNFDDPQNDPRAHDLVRKIEEFVRVFKQRAGRHSGRVIMDEHTQLDSREIEQKSERFIEEELIARIADVLGWEIRFQPKGFAGLEGRIPDFEILNLDVENFGEVKTPGGIVEARKESVEYLDLATERPLVGVATDGFYWILYIAGKGEEPAYTNHESIYPIVDKIRKEEHHERASRRDRIELRKEAYEFVNEFEVSAIQNKCESSRD